MLNNKRINKHIAIIKKDIQAIAANKRMASVMLVVPLVMTVALPSIFIASMLFSSPEELAQMAGMFEAAGFAGNGGFAQLSDLRQPFIMLIINYVMPLFFLFIPIMVSSVMAASAFVGEKEKKTLETLLYCPLPLKEIFNAKILASFILSMAVSALSFIVMLAVIEAELLILTGTMAAPGINWLIIMLLVSPSISLLAINLIVRGSAKSQSVEESQQRAVLLILPIILLVTGQFTGIMMLSAWLLLALGAVIAAIALFLFKGSFGKFQYETLLQ
jgi:ABC-type Na+ efflux pump permease subunit